MLNRVLDTRLDTLFQDQNIKSNTLHVVMVKKRASDQWYFHSIQIKN